MRVAIQGERGAYSEEATQRLHPGAEVLPCPRLPEVFEALRTARADAAVVPLENSQAGSITEAYDLMLEHPLSITAELDLRIRHCLLALPGQALAELQTAHSHPQALAQCDVYLRSHHLEPVAAYDTAGSAKRISEERTLGAAAIASRVAGEIYGLAVLAEGIETHPNNRTRFVSLSEKVPPRLPGGAWKTSLVLGTAHLPGALHRALGTLALRGINLTKLESRPSRKVAWEYVFYLDLDGHAEDAPLADALRELRADCAFMRVLGSYPKSPPH